MCAAPGHNDVRLDMQRPLISIVIPAFNEARFIGACLESLQRQDFPGPYEIVVADNNSTDATSAIARKFGARVVFASQPGVCAARQAGTEAAGGQIIVSTDADTVFPINWLSRIWESFSADPDIIAVAGQVEYVAAPWWARLYSSWLFGFVNLVYRHTGQVKYITACNTAFRKSAWSGYNTKLAQGGDELDLLARLKTKGKIIFQPNVMVYTSSRRLRQGLIYNLFVTIGWYYLFDYFVGRRVGKSIFGSYAPIRQENPSVNRVYRIVQPVVLLIVMTFIFSSVTHNALAERLVKNAQTRFAAIQSRFDRDGHR